MSDNMDMQHDDREDPLKKYNDLEDFPDMAPKTYQPSNEGDIGFDFEPGKVIKKEGDDDIILIPDGVLRYIELEHINMVKDKAKPGEAILSQLTPEKCHLLHMSVGASLESGELLENVRNYTIYNKELDIENVIEELGDLSFYIEGVRAIIGLSWDEIKQANIDKLNKRYKKKYTDQEAKERADKQEQRPFRHSTRRDPPEISSNNGEER